MYNKGNKYQIILADCPWSYDDKMDNNPKYGGITYPTLKHEDLKALPIKDIADKDCVLFFWTTMPMLEKAFDIINSWGFSYVTCAFTWIKTNPDGTGIRTGIGKWTNSNAELCLLARIGKPKRIKTDVKQVIMAPIGRHSAKPSAVREKIVELMGDKPRIELFARSSKKLENGWINIGNEVDGQDIRDSMVKIINGTYLDD